MVKVCPPEKILNPETGRCIDKNGKLAKKLGLKVSPKKVSPKKVSPKKADDKCKDKKCKKDQICNPETGRCVSKTGKVGLTLTGKVTKKRKDKILFLNYVPVQKPTLLGKFSPTQPLGKCLEPKIPLSYSQKETVKYFNKNKALLVVHGTGMGKTLIAVAASKCYLDEFPTHRVVVISPASLLKNLHKEMKKYGRNIDNRYSFYSFDKYLNDVKKNKAFNCSDTLLIIDEAHNLKNIKGSKYFATMTCATRAHKVLLLTATPFVNSMKDFIPLINILNGKYILGPPISSQNVKILNNSLASLSTLTDEQFEKQMDTVKHFLKGKISFAPKKPEDENFPKYKIHEDLIEMTSEYQKKFMNVLKSAFESIWASPERLYHGYRKAVNKLGGDYFSQKVDFIVKDMKNDRSVIYTNWLEFGIAPISKVLNRVNKKFRVISGATTKSDRNEYVKEFNEGKVQILLITKAGSEGIDLKGVRKLYVLDPVWTYAMLEQIIGRGVRFRSHTHLPKNEQMVDIHLISLIEKNIDPINSLSGDVILYRYINIKKSASARVDKMLKSISII